MQLNTVRGSAPGCVSRIRGKFGENPSQPSLPLQSEYPPSALRKLLLDMKSVAVLRSHQGRGMLGVYPYVRTGSLRFFAHLGKKAFFVWERGTSPLRFPTVGMLCEKAFSVLFGKIAAKRTKNGDWRVSLVATSDEGFAPSTCANF